MEKRKCIDGCGKYNKTIDEIPDAASKHREKLIALKQVADEQKEKIFCLRGHRDELLDEIDKINLQHEYERKEKEEIVASLEEAKKDLNQQMWDQQEEIVCLKSRIKDFELTTEKRSMDVEIIKANSIADEIESVHDISLDDKKHALNEAQMDLKEVLIKTLEDLTKKKMIALDKLKKSLEQLSQKKKEK